MRLTAVFRIIACMVVSLVILTLCASPALASVGVGIDLGKIELNESLVPGGTYHLPAVGIINTGSETSDYQVEIIYMDDQQELKPAIDWFRFEPQKFTLGAGVSKKVAITLQIPMHAGAGSYFALIEAHPVAQETGSASIAVGAATKLSFKIKEANIAVAAAHRVADFFRDSSPFIYIGFALFAVIVLIFIFRRSFRLNFKLEKKG
jgi:hypothetical protein